MAARCGKIVAARHGMLSSFGRKEVSSRWCSTRPVVWYQSDKVPRSLTATGRVGTYRDNKGTDEEFFGCDPVAVEVEVSSARGKPFNMDQNGFELRQHAWEHIDYYDNDAVLRKYYPECEKLVQKALGAKSVLAFDHNLRAKLKKDSGVNMLKGNAVQEPLITYGVHNDYSKSSAPRRVELLAQTPKANDTLKPLLGERPAIDPVAVPELLQRRYAFVNVWRSITSSPVERYPLAFVDAQTVSKDDLVVFEIKYADRTGENYFARHRSSHRWYYCPKITKDEVVLLKCWDSRGADFADGAPEGDLVPATFSLHTGFEDPATPEDAPDRESIEVRTIAFFDE